MSFADEEYEKMVDAMYQKQQEYAARDVAMRQAADRRLYKEDMMTKYGYDFGNELSQYFTDSPPTHPKKIKPKKSLITYLKVFSKHAK